MIFFKRSASPCKNGRRRPDASEDPSPLVSQVSAKGALAVERGHAGADSVLSEVRERHAADRECGAMKHKTKLHAPRLADLSAESWSYDAKKSRNVYIRVLQRGKHVVTVQVRVPKSTPRLKVGV